MPINSALQESNKKPETSADDVKKPSEDVSHAKDLQDEKKVDSKEETTVDKEKKLKVNKSSKADPEPSASKDAATPKTEVEKSNTAIERKSSPSSVQVIPAKPLENDESNVKASSESSNKKETTESVQNKKEEKKLTPPPGNNIESTEGSVDNKPIKEVNNTALIEKEEPAKITKSSEKAETVNNSKPTSTNKIIAEETIKVSTESTKKESATVAATPVKKVGRQAKIAKSKSGTPAAQATPSVDIKSSDVQQGKPAASSARVKRKSKTTETTASEPAQALLTPKDDNSDRKSKRHRLKTILYQSPLPELAYITKLSASEASNSPKPMSNEDRLIVFYKNEYMAVRNAEGTFYLCQTMQNVYRTSPRISIRWLSEDAKDNNVFIPDFYDHTDIECVLTTVELKRIDKGHLRLPKVERSRIESILKKAIDVEKGLVPRPELTEENPDGRKFCIYL